MLFSSKEKTESVSDYPPDSEYAGGGYPTAYSNDDGPPQCPPHTTERKLVARIDLHVVPFLCIMYRELVPTRLQ